MEEFDKLKLEKLIDDWKERGAVSTPLKIAEFMVDLSKPSKSDKILDAGCGLGNFLYVLQNKNYNNIIGIELNDKIIPDQFPVIHGDFLLHEFDEMFDLIIGNPPYGIPAVGTHYPIKIEKNIKDLYKNFSKTWKGKYNLYALFMEKAIKTVKNNGKVCFIIPSTWLFLDEFSLLREFISSQGETHFYHMGNWVFKNVSVHVGIFLFEKNGKNNFTLYKVSEKFECEKIKTIENWKGERIDFSINSLNGIALKDLFNICISIRSNALYKYQGTEIHYMTGKNIQKNHISRKDYSNKKTNWEYIEKMKKEYMIVPRLVVRHTSPYPICAVETEIYPYTGDVYHLVPKTNLTEQQLVRICEFLNSDFIKSYFYETYQNIIPHVMKWQLEELKIPYEIIGNS